ncbi:MAG: efflux RND transporter permease subunit [Deltaproteobacteria bacterium]|nr:efflux RND transporter permease subunit [Deltaproteobacteria bacterium]
MIGKLVEASVQGRLLVILAMLALVALGVRSYIALPIDATPDITNVQVQVLTTAPGLSPVEMEMMVTYPVELVLTGMPGVQRMRSISRAGISAITIIFDDGFDLQLARSIVSQRLPMARERIPASAGSPQMGPLTTGLGEVYHFMVNWPGHTPRDVRTVLDWDIAYRLRSVPGVVEVNAWGGETRQAEIRIKTDALLSYGLTHMDVERAIQAAGQNAGAGAIERGDEQIFIRVEGVFRSLDQIANQVVTTRPGGVPILVKDVADVENGSALRLASASADGKGEVVYAMVQMIAAGNAHEIVARVKDRLTDIKKALPQGVEIVPFYDRAQLVDEVLHTVKKNLIEGGIVVAVVLFIMLGDFTAGIVVASAIPLAMLGAFALMANTGQTGNLMSLGAIDFGLVVDGAVVMVEGALAAMTANRISARRGMVQIGNEAGRPIAMGVFIIAIVYAPILLLEGVEGRMFRPMAWTVLFALGTALILTFTWVPAFGSLLIRKIHEHDPWIIRQIRKVYDPLLMRVLHRPVVVVPAVLLIAGVGIGVGSQMGAEFVPRLEEGDLVVQVTRPPSVSLTESTHGTMALESALLKFPEVEHVIARVGSPDVATDVMGVEMADVFVLLKPRAEWKTARDANGFADAMTETANKALPGSALAFTQPIEMRMNELIGGVKSDMGVKIYGDDIPTLNRLAAEVSRLISNVQGAADIRVEPTKGLLLLTVRPDPKRMARLGARTDEVVAFVEMMRAGREVGSFLEGQKRFNVVVRLAKTPLTDPEVVRRLLVPLSNGTSAPLGDLADIEQMEGPAQVSREQARRRILVEANVRNRDLSSFVQEVQSKIDQVKMPTGYYTEFGGQYENLARATQRLMIVVPTTLAVILVLLYLAFGAMRPAALIFINIPAAASGGFLALYFRDLPFSISAAVGFIALFGVATLNGVVLIASIRNHEKAGEPTEQAVSEASKTRVRPVLTTAAVAALGFLPMAIATGTGAEVQRPLATVVMGGLVTATLVTLLALPTLYLRWGADKPDHDLSMRPPPPHQPPPPPAPTSLRQPPLPADLGPTS